MKNWKRILTGLCLMFAFVLAPMESPAQCPMCKMSAESNLSNGGSAGKGLNQGIIYMFLTPYFLVATIGFFWYRKNKKRKSKEDQMIENLMNDINKGV